MERPELNADKDELNDYIDHLLSENDRLEGELEDWERENDDLKDEISDLEKQVVHIEEVEYDAEMYRKRQDFLSNIPEDMDIVTEAKIIEYIKFVTQ